MRRNMLQYFLLLLFVSNYVESNSDCGKKENAVSYLDLAVDIINRAKSNMLLHLNIQTNFTNIPVDCADILRMGHRSSGMYTIRPNSRLTEDKLLDVYCDMVTDGGGWTVLQRRGNYGKPNDYFFKEWKSYKSGFGNIQKDFWLGNDNIFALTNQKLYSARLDFQDIQFNKTYALYDYFWIDDEFNSYTLHVEGFSGPAGDSFKSHNSMKFTTKDVDNDNSKDGNCAVTYKGAWWYNNCHQSNLNGLYFRSVTSTEGINWVTWKGRESLEFTEIKIRPMNFMVPNDFTKTPQ